MRRGALTQGLRALAGVTDAATSCSDAPVWTSWHQISFRPHERPLRWPSWHRGNFALEARSGGRANALYRLLSVPARGRYPDWLTRNVILGIVTATTCRRASAPHRFESLSRVS